MFPSGRIDYKTVNSAESPTNMVKDVPSELEALGLTKRLLPRIGIGLSDVTKPASSEPDLHVSADEVTYFSNQTAVTIIKWRSVGFRRVVDNMVISGGNGGYLHFGEGGKLCEIGISWHILQRIKSFRTYSVERTIRLFHEGKAFQGLVPGDFGRIDWRTVKSVTVTKAVPCYCAGKSDVLYPFLALSAVVEADRGKVEIEIDCPMIDEAQSLTE